MQLLDFLVLLLVYLRMYACVNLHTLCLSVCIVITSMVLSRAGFLEWVECMLRVVGCYCCMCVFCYCCILVCFYDRWYGMD